MQILICTECFCAVSLPCAHIVIYRVLTHFSDFALEKFRVRKTSSERMQMISAGNAYFQRCRGEISAYIFNWLLLEEERKIN